MANLLQSHRDACREYCTAVSFLEPLPFVIGVYSIDASMKLALDGRFAEAAFYSTLVALGFYSFDLIRRSRRDMMPRELTRWECLESNVED